MALRIAHVAYNLPEADMLKTYLNGYGIHAFVFDHYLSRMAPHYTVAYGGIRIMVPESQLEDAQLLISDLKPSSLETECEAFGKTWWYSIPTFLFSILAGIWFPAWVRARRIWKDDDMGEEAMSSHTNV